MAGTAQIGAPADQLRGTPEPQQSRNPPKNGSENPPSAPSWTGSWRARGPGQDTGQPHCPIVSWVAPWSSGSREGPGCRRGDAGGSRGGGQAQSASSQTATCLGPLPQGRSTQTVAGASVKEGTQPDRLALGSWVGRGALRFLCLLSKAQTQGRCGRWPWAPSRWPGEAPALLFHPGSCCPGGTGRRSPENLQASLLAQGSNVPGCVPGLTGVSHKPTTRVSTSFFSPILRLRSNPNLKPGLNLDLGTIPGPDPDPGPNPGSDHDPDPRAMARRTYREPAESCPLWTPGLLSGWDTCPAWVDSGSWGPFICNFTRPPT